MLTLRSRMGKGVVVKMDRYTHTHIYSGGKKVGNPRISTQNKYTI